MKHDIYIKSLILNDQIVGLTSCILCKDNKIFEAYGYKSIDNNKFTNINTKYDVASLTKVLTTVPIISKLIDNKEITFKTRVKSILPEFKYDDVTIYDMLIHASGLPSTLNMNGKEQSRESIINEIFKLDKVYNTETDVIYSDIGYIILGLLIERIYNIPLDIIVQNEIFRPLNMYNTTYNPKDKESCAPTEYIDSSQTSCYQGIVHDWKARMMNGVAGHAGVFSTAEDIGNYMQMILNDGYYNNRKFISKEILDMWFEVLAYESKSDRYRSLCWIHGFNKYVINAKNNNTISFHGFAGPSISLDRDNNMGICLMSNSVHPLRENRTTLNTVRPIITDMIYNDYENKKSIKKKTYNISHP